MNRLGGPRRKSRHKYTKPNRTRGKISISNFMQTFEAGQRVHLRLEPAHHHGLYHQRFVGKTGVVKAQRGSCYEVAISDHGKEKTLLVHPVHLKRSQ